MQALIFLFKECSTDSSISKSQPSSLTSRNIAGVYTVPLHHHHLPVLVLVLLVMLVELEQRKSLLGRAQTSQLERRFKSSNMDWGLE